MDAETQLAEAKKKSALETTHLRDELIHYWKISQTHNFDAATKYISALLTCPNVFHPEIESELRFLWDISLLQNWKTTNIDKNIWNM